MKLVAALVILTLSTPAVWAGSKGDVQAGKAAFTTSCKTCHGLTGEGNPAIAKALKVNIPVLASKEVQGKSDEDLKKAIATGTGKMKPVQGLSSRQVQDVISYVRSLAK
ncbi:MAG: cytochrome c [Acidobacteria bacterium]|nr:cytochrome c [Acidobacteriota bacterium]